ncbi:MAG TPA: hypothetical protein VD926_11985, partial [Acidimicrobiales bacterium]|nr:hypothetical protein [Acidimicrobiales bacterium]
MRARTPVSAAVGPRLVRRVCRRIAVTLALAAVLAAGTAAPASAGPTFGSEPLDDVRHWAAEEARCGLTPNKLTALMLAPVFPETGAPSGTSPSPMTLSRWDDQPGLHSFGTTSGQPRAFWHPGVGVWQLDASGMGSRLTAAQGIDTFVAARHVAATIAARWCDEPTMAYA